MNTPKNLLIANPDQNFVLTPVEVIRRMFAYVLFCKNAFKLFLSLKAKKH